MPEPTLSVVVALPEGAALAECLEALAGQLDAGTEVIVASTVGPPPEIDRASPWVVWVEAPSGRLIPDLWGMGLDRARGEVVAFTTAHFVPSPDWLAVIRDSHLRLASPATGGPIDPPRGRGAPAWATYFLRYSAYLCRDAEEAVTDLAGDNAAYKRRALASHAEASGQGFWEQEIHRRLLREGETLTWVPRMRVSQRGSFPVRSFLRQRFLHGMRFGRHRLRGRGWALRAAAILGSPLIPAVFFSKIAARVLRCPRDRWALLPALPFLLAFLMAWSAGEAWGYLRPESRGGRRAPFKRRVSPS